MFILYFDKLNKKWRLDRKWFVARKKSNQIRAQEVISIKKNHTLRLDTKMDIIITKKVFVLVGLKKIDNNIRLTINNVQSSLLCNFYFYGFSLCIVK